MFYEMSCSQKFRTIYKKALVLESLYKCSPVNHGVCEYCEIFKNNYFEENLRISASSQYNAEKCFRVFSERFWVNFENVFVNRAFDRNVH